MLVLLLVLVLVLALALALVAVVVVAVAAAAAAARVEAVEWAAVQARRTSFNFNVFSSARLMRHSLVGEALAVSSGIHVGPLRSSAHTHSLTYAHTYPYAHTHARTPIRTHAHGDRQTGTG